MIKITRFFYIHWSIFPLFLLAYWSGGIYTLLAAYAVVVVHELFHFFAALLVKEGFCSLLVLVILTSYPICSKYFFAALALFKLRVGSVSLSPPLIPYQQLVPDPVQPLS